MYNNIIRTGIHVIEILEEYNSFDRDDKMRLIFSRTTASRETLDGLVHHGDHTLDTCGNIS